MIKLSKRLQLVASFVPDNSYLIDVGCDHALLDIYLINNLKNIKIIASDVNPKPLEIARENIKKFGLEKDIEVILNDGITNLKREVDTIVISGMGGILISEILNKGNLENIKNIILAPNNDFPLVRKTIIKNNFYIEKEELLIEKDITYLVIKAKKGKSKRINYFFGTLDNKDLNTIYYYTKILNTNTKILKKLPKKYLLKRIKIILENKKIKRFLNK